MSCQIHVTEIANGSVEEIANADYALPAATVLKDSTEEELAAAKARCENLNNTPFSERVRDHTIYTYNYTKHDGGQNGKHPQRTGRALLMNMCKNLAVVDIDVNKSYSNEQKQTVRTNVLAKLGDQFQVVQTGGGGLHIYCNTGARPSLKSRTIKCYKSPDFDIDIFTSVDPESRSLVVLPGTRVRKEVNRVVVLTEYEWVHKLEHPDDDYDPCINKTLDEVSDALGIPFELFRTEDVEAIMTEHSGSEFAETSPELAAAIVHGIGEFVVHNDGAKKLDEAVTLYSLFQAINCLPLEWIDEAYERARRDCKLTEKAHYNFDAARSRYTGRCTSIYVLVKILRIYRPDYYEQCVKALAYPKPKTLKIDFEDPITLDTIIIRLAANEYSNEIALVEDLTRVMRYINGSQHVFVQKTRNCLTGTFRLSFVYRKDMYAALNDTVAFHERGGDVTLGTVVKKNLHSFIITGVLFKSDDPDIMSIYRGYKYKVLDGEADENVIGGYLKLIREVICRNDPSLYEYVLSWIGFIIQNPGVKTGVTMVLKGLQGTGKNTFTNVLCELLSGYSAPNVTDIAELTGTFNSVLEGRMLIVLNEVKNAGENRGANFDSLKSLITDSDVRINEKSEPRRDGENVANFIMLTNNWFPVKVNVGDRRYCVVDVSAVYKDNMSFFDRLHKDFARPDFYDNLLTFFTKRSCSAFRIGGPIPMTEARTNLIEASLPPIQSWINEHYDELLTGFVCKKALASRPGALGERTFQNQIKEKCDRERESTGDRRWMYVLKEEHRGLYHQTVRDDIDEEPDCA